MTQPDMDTTEDAVRRVCSSTICDAEKGVTICEQAINVYRDRLCTHNAKIELAMSILKMLDNRDAMKNED